jgi:hypothetical protein
MKAADIWSWAATVLVHPLTGIGISIKCFIYCGRRLLAKSLTITTFLNLQSSSSSQQNLAWKLLCSTRWGIQYLKMCEEFYRLAGKNQKRGQQFDKWFLT